MRIRRGVEADAAVLAGLARRSKASWGYPEHWLREWEPELRISEGYLKANAVFVAESQGRAVGVIGLGPGPDGPEIAHLWIAPESQGQGLGRTLVECAKRVAQEEGWPSLRILSDPQAQPFYERMGALKVGEAPAPMDGTQRVLPVLRLDIPSADDERGGSPPI